MGKQEGCDVTSYRDIAMKAAVAVAVAVAMAVAVAAVLNRFVAAAVDAAVAMVDAVLAELFSSKTRSHITL
jgi:hypothetical protein